MGCECITDIDKVYLDLQKLTGVVRNRCGEIPMKEPERHAFHKILSEIDDLITCLYHHIPEVEEESETESEIDLTVESDEEKENKPPHEQ